MFPDIGLIKIHSVYLPTALHPVLNEDELSPLFTSSNIPLWSADGGVNPCTINLAKCNDQQAFVKIQWPGSTAECPVRLQGQLESGDQFGQNDSFVMPAAQEIVVVPIKLTVGSTVVPWGINSTITWTLESVSTEGKVETKCPFPPHPIQIYAVSARLPPFLSYPGIPQEVLDFFPFTTRELPNIKTFMQYVEHVVKRVHTDAGSRYERFHGSTTFSDITASSGTSDLNISKWVVDMRAHRTTPSSPSYTVNCYDQGAIVQLGLILGIQTPEEETKVRWHYLHPFGFINTLHLVGWGPCNNPFSPGGLEVAREATERKAFGNHVFLSYDWKVLDATVGPATGTKSIKDYMKEAIDSDASLYTRDEYHLAAYSRQDCPTGGLLSDVISGHGVQTLSTGLALNDDIMPWAVTEFLTKNGLPNSAQSEDSHPGQSGYTYAFGDLTEALKNIQLDDGTTLHFGEPTYNSGLTDAQWTWNTEPGSHRVDLLISISATSELARFACGVYLSGVSDSLPDAFVAGKEVVKNSLHLVGAPGTGMGFSLWVVGRLLVVLKGLHTNDELRPIVQKMNEHKVQDVPRFETVTMEDHYCNLNATTKLEIQIKDALDYSVRYTTGNVLVVKAEYKEGKYCFDFIGRQYGLDIVTLTITNTSGHHISYNVPFVMRDDTGSIVPKPDPAGAMTSPKYSTTDSIGNTFKGDAFSSWAGIENGLKDNITAMHVSVTQDGIHSIQPIYSNESPAPPEADNKAFVLESDDFITIVTGGVDTQYVLQWIQFYTNKGHKSVEFGNKDQGTPFSWSGPKLMAFSGRRDAVVNALRAHWLNPDSTSPSVDEIAKVANLHSKVVGGDRGDMLSSDARLAVDLASQHLTGLSVRFSSTSLGPLSAIVAQYGDVYGKTLGGFGGKGVGDRRASFELNTPDEWIVEITGHTKVLNIDNRALRFVTTIQFHTNKGNHSREYGKEPYGHGKEPYEHEKELYGERFSLKGDRLVYLSGQGDSWHGVVALQAHWLGAGLTGGRDGFVE